MDSLDPDRASRCMISDLDTLCLALQYIDTILASRYGTDSSLDPECVSLI